MVQMSLLIQSLQRDGWFKRAIKVGLSGNSSCEIQTNYQAIHLVGSAVFQRMLQVQFPFSQRDRLAFLVELVTNSQGKLDFSPNARYHFDPQLGPAHPFLQQIARWVCHSYPKTNSQSVGLNDHLGKKLQLFRQLIDQHNIRFLRDYAQEQHLPVFAALLKYCQEQQIKPQFQVSANFHSKYLKQQQFTRQKNFKVEVGRQVSEFVFSLELGHSLVSQWVTGTRLLPDGSMDLSYPYSLGEQENILDGESFNYGYVGQKGQHWSLDVNQPKIADVRTYLKRQNKWTSPSNFAANPPGQFADLIRHNSLVDLAAWDDYQKSCQSNETLLTAKYHDFVAHCQSQKLNKGFAAYYRQFGSHHWFQKNPDEM